MKDTCHEKNGRSIAKAVSYRIVSILVDFALVYLLTRKIELTLTVVIISNTASIFVYYFHERAWNRVHLGRRPNNG